MSVCSSGPLADITQGVLDSSQVRFLNKVVKMNKQKFIHQLFLYSFCFLSLQDSIEQGELEDSVLEDNQVITVIAVITVVTFLIFF
jgi:hypothetical protein